MSATLPEAVASTTSLYLQLVDEALPGRVSGLYLTGSVPLGDFHPQTSDIDGVVILTEPLDDPDPVRSVHAALPSKPAFDVAYLTAADLALPPDRSKPVVFTLDGVFKEAPLGGPVSPVLWSEMARASLPVRTAPDLLVHDDQQALRDYTSANLMSYWVPTLDSIAEHIDGRPDHETLEEWVVPWCVLGVPRLHALLTTGEIVSKTAAGRHGAARFPAWASLCERCIDHRAGTTQTFTVRDARETVAFGRAVVADAATAG
ncbi:MAG TPA: hypothetical protein VFT31_11715 [Kribbella sp.]|nr:hypothetical protein [Kribbella sp.]